MQNTSGLNGGDAVKNERYIFVAYDIKNDGLRTDLSKRLRFYGLVRQQYSVFKGEVTICDKEAIIREIEAMGLGDEDKVHIIDLCEHCQKNQTVIGRDIVTPQHLVV